ncbi:MAG TPA: hypothetical protein VKM72_11100 [Thermoanaerobaculia bacterium]|nr:hypothetical protein [Thermoanaerobaculia bacterium]
MRTKTPRYVLLVPDGAADLYREDGRSPLALAHTPYTDFLAREGVSGRMRTFYPDLPRESMVAQLGMLGWDPRIYYPHGRSSCELLALQHVYLGDDDLAFRANLVRMEGRTLASYSASCISSADARPLVERVDQILHSEFPEIELYPNSDFRNTLVIRGARVDPRRLVCSEPHEHQGREFEVASLIAGTDPASHALAARINAWLARAAALLEGEAANALFPWSASRAFRLPPFAMVSGFPGRVGIVGFMDFLLGIAHAGEIDFFRLGNGRPDTDFQSKGAKVVELLAAGYDLVVCHVNAPDEASHLGDLKLKIQCLEAFDRDVVGPVVEYFRSRPDELGGVMVAPDHYTNHVLEGQRALAHSLDPAPFCLWNGVDRDGVTAFDEDAVLAGRYGATPVSHLDLLGLLGVERTAAWISNRHRKGDGDVDGAF